jgi:hypothetical protein
MLPRTRIRFLGEDGNRGESENKMRAKDLLSSSFNKAKARKRNTSSVVHDIAITKSVFSEFQKKNNRFLSISVYYYDQMF